MRSAKSAFQSAVELDPALAEGYTALAELALSTPPNDVDEAIGLAGLAAHIDNDNFGAHRIMARLFTYKSNLNTGIINQTFATKAVSEWKEVTRLDPRNAEGWAFLSEFYFYSGKDKRADRCAETLDGVIGAARDTVLPSRDGWQRKPVARKRPAEAWNGVDKRRQIKGSDRSS